MGCACSLCVWLVEAQEIGQERAAHFLVGFDSTTLLWVYVLRRKLVRFFCVFYFSLSSSRDRPRLEGAEYTLCTSAIESVWVPCLIGKLWAQAAQALDQGHRAVSCLLWRARREGRHRRSWSAFTYVEPGKTIQFGFMRRGLFSPPPIPVLSSSVHKRRSGGRFGNTMRVLLLAFTAEHLTVSVDRQQKQGGGNQHGAAYKGGNGNVAGRGEGKIRGDWRSTH